MELFEALVIIHPQAGAADAAAPRRLLPLVRRQDLRAQAARPLGPGQRYSTVQYSTVQYTGARAELAAVDSQ